MNYFIQFLLILFSLPFWFTLNIPQPYYVSKFLIQQDSVFLGPTKISELENKNIDEASGLAFSRVLDGIIYTHNDSGDKSVVYMIDTLGRDRGTIKFKSNFNRDWEDIAVGPGPDKNLSYVYVGEIGDNEGKHKKIRIYRFPEPTASDQNLEIEPDFINLVYPDGPRDAETLMLDPITQDLFIISKRDSMNVLYRIPQSAFDQEIFVMEKVMELPFTMAVAGDISQNGSEILVKNYFMVLYWERNEGESIPDALKRKPLLLPYKPEPQGEAIAFHPSGNSYFTLSEKRFGIEPVLYRYERK